MKKDGLETDSSIAEVRFIPGTFLFVAHRTMGDKCLDGLL